MAFGISATAWLAGSVVALAATSAYSAIKQNQAAKSQRGALQQQQAGDAAAQAKAEADAANEANAQRVAQKRAYQANALALGGNGDDSLGAPGVPRTALAGGAGGVSRGAPVTGGSTTVLGGGAPAPGAGGVGGAGGSGGRSRFPRGIA